MGERQSNVQLKLLIMRKIENEHYCFTIIKYETNFAAKNIRIQYLNKYLNTLFQNSLFNIVQSRCDGEEMFTFLL